MYLKKTIGSIDFKYDTKHGHWLCHASIKGLRNTT